MPSQFSHYYGYNAVRGHRTGSNNSGAEDYLSRKTNKNRIHTITNLNKSYTDNNKNVRSAYVRIKVHTCIYILNESQQKPKPRRQHSARKEKTG